MPSSRCLAYQEHVHWSKILEFSVAPPLLLSFATVGISALEFPELACVAGGGGIVFPILEEASMEWSLTLDWDVALQRVSTFAYCWEKSLGAQGFDKFSSLSVLESLPGIIHGYSLLPQ